MFAFFIVMKGLGMVSKRSNRCKNFLSCKCSTEANDEIMFWEDEHNNKDIVDELNAENGGAAAASAVELREV